MLFAVFIFLMYMVFAISLVVLPASASVTELFPYYLVIWGFVGLHGFIIILFCLGVRFLGARKWFLFLVMLGGSFFKTIILMRATCLHVDTRFKQSIQPFCLIGLSVNCN